MEQTVKDKVEKVAIFKYGIIAPVLHASSKERNEYFKSLENKELDVPYYGIKKYTAATFKDWLFKYKNGGLDNLYPSIRSDAGKSKKITDKVVETIKQIISDFPYLSISGIYRMLIHEGYINTCNFTESTLRNYICKNKLKEGNSMDKPRKKFEKENVNELWISDFMVGPYITIKGKKQRVYLCGIEDDHSRVITGAGWFLHENCISLALTLKKAISIYGIPYTFYCDNGKTFVTNYLHLICARLGIALVHSSPYDGGPARGKIERFFQTIRQKFLSCLDIPSIKDLEEFNRLFEKWLDEEYHKQFHSGIQERPIDRYLKSAAKVKIRTVSTAELDNFFLNTITRKVKNDSTVSIQGKLYEVPVEYIGKKVELRFPIDNPDKITIYENNQPICLIRQVNLSENATAPYTGIHFKDINKKKGGES